LSDNNNAKKDGIKKFSKILIAIDGSEQSINAANYAVSIAMKDDAELIAMTVIHESLSSYGLAVPPDKIQQAKQRHILESKQWFDKFNQQVKKSNVRLKREIYFGQISIEAAIVEYAESENVDLVVIGTKGRSEFKKLLLGSVASGVVKYAHCPVMVIK
jgi:nucleotide-binding universal stress UspA family protein